MNNKELTRRTFMKKSSIGTAGIALAPGSMISVNVILQNPDKPAILGGTPVRPSGSTLGASWPIYDETDIQDLVTAFESKRWSEYSNNETELAVQFERAFAALMGTNYCAATNAGTNALEASLRALDVGPGDEVITQTNTFIASAQCAFNVYALPVFIDSDPETFMINADLIEERINANTKAILPVHIGGAAADMDKIMTIAKKHNLAVIEDACQAHMGEWKYKKLGSIGNLGCFSFQVGKSLSGGEGGAIIGNDDEIMARVDAYTNNGRDPKGLNRTFQGSNYRMHPFVAATLLGQIKRLETQSSLRDENALYFDQLLAGIQGVRPTKKIQGQTRRAYYLYQLIYENEHFNGLPKLKFMEAMRAEGIGFRHGIDSSLHRHPFIETYLNMRAFQKLFSIERLNQYRAENQCPVNEYIESETGLSLGQTVFLGSKKDLEDVVTAIMKIQKYSSDLLIS